MAQLTEKARALFDDPNFATLSTVEPDGGPQSTLVWVKRDGDDLLFALPEGRRKIDNMRRDPRVSVVVFDAATPYENIQVRGTATVTDDPDGTLVEEMSQEYLGRPYPGFAGPDPKWVVVRVVVDRVITTPPPR